MSALRVGHLFSYTDASNTLLHFNYALFLPLPANGNAQA
jgi:hypothetical protein